MTPLSHIRNFSIIAHIDHGKSTLADRLIERCGALASREMSSRVLDSMDLEQERGITIKSQSVTLRYDSPNGVEYQLNLIDTPGHVDFHYEVSRSLAACEGALLLVDAAQGVEAQSVANCLAAIEQDIEVLPVLNKIDLPQAEPERVAREIEELVGLDASEVLCVSAKTGEGMDELLERLVTFVPPPQGRSEGHLRALIVDSWFDQYLGIVSLVRVMQGCVRAGDRILVSSLGRTHEVTEVGGFTPRRVAREGLNVGEVGYLVAGIKDVHGAPVGDTFLSPLDPNPEPLPGFQRVKPLVYAGLFPVDSDDFEQFRTALERLRLNDASLHYEPETSDALGFGFRCGFLGTLHMEVVQERLEREYGLALISSAPTVLYEIELTSGEVKQIQNPSTLPDLGKVKEIREPVSEVTILTTKESVGKVMNLCVERRGYQVSLDIRGSQAALVWRLPMSEVVLDFHDRLKSVTRGFGSMDYVLMGFEREDLVRLDILVNGDVVDALAMIVHRQVSRQRGLEMLSRLKTLIPRQMFDVALQAAIGSQIIARQTVKALRKNVTAKCYGGDVTRKKKLLKKQKEGKKRMKRLGSVEIPQEAFLAALARDES